MHLWMQYIHLIDTSLMFNLYMLCLVWVWVGISLAHFDALHYYGLPCIKWLRKFNFCWQTTWFLLCVDLKNIRLNESHTYRWTILYVWVAKCALLGTNYLCSGRWLIPRDWYHKHNDLISMQANGMLFASLGYHLIWKFVGLKCIPVVLMTNLTQIEQKFWGQRKVMLYMYWSPKTLRCFSYNSLGPCMAKYPISRVSLSVIIIILQRPMMNDDLSWVGDEAVKWMVLTRAKCEVYVYTTGAHTVWLCGVYWSCQATRSIIIMAFLLGIRLLIHNHRICINRHNISGL